MKFSCERTMLLNEVVIAQEVIASRSAFSILSNVYLEANEDALLIKATDLKIGFETTIAVDVSTPGSTTVYCDKFLSILRSLPEEEIEFEQRDDGILSITPVFKRIDFELKSISPDKYPELQRIPDENYFEFPQGELVDMISKTVFAVSDDETRYYMNGAYLEKIQEELIMVTTDGRRLSFVSKKTVTTVENIKGIIIPPKVLHLLRKLSLGEGNLLLSITEKNIFIKFSNHKLSSTLIDGEFPNYQRVIPESNTNKIIVKKDLFDKALRRISLLVEQKSRKIILNASEQKLVVFAEESDIGKASEEIECDYDGPDASLALNYVYLLDPLREMEAESLSIEFTEVNKAVTLKPFPEEDYLHIVMPMQTS